MTETPVSGASPRARIGPLQTLARSEPRTSDDFYTNVATLPLASSSTFIRSFSGGGFGGGFGGGQFRFVSTLSSMKTLLEEFKAGRVRQYGDVRMLSQ